MLSKLQSGSIQQNNQVAQTGQSAPKAQSYFLTFRRPDAQHFGPEYGISYAQSLVAHLGIKVDKSFKLEPYLTPKDAQGVRWVVYTVRADATPAAAKRAERELGMDVEKERIVTTQG
jgi:hypothetical protein